MLKKSKQTAIIDVKFDEEFELWIRLQDEENPENAEICRKTSKKYR